MIVLDTSVLYALLDRADRRHDEARSWYEALERELVTTPFVLAETDHLTRTRLGADAARAFRADIRAGAYEVAWWPDAATTTSRVADRYAPLGVSLTDASLVAVAHRVGTIEIATFDDRHFRAMRPLGDGPGFRLLPADA